MASVRRHRALWQAVWAVYEEGRRVQRSRGFSSYAEAKAHAAKMELLERRGVGTSRITLGEYLTDWLTAKQTEVEANTYAGYQRHVGHVRRCHMTGIALDALTPKILEDGYRYLLKVPSGRGKPLSAQSVRHINSVLQNALADAVRHRMLDSNPAAQAKAPRGQSPKVEVPSATQIQELLVDLTAHNPDLIDLALFIIGTGVRRSEALGLRWSDIDWSGRIHIRQVVIEHAGKWSIRQGTKSIAGQRSISIDEYVVEALRHQQARVAELRLKLGRLWQQGYDLVFPNTEGGPRAPASVTKAFTRAARRAGWPAHSSPVHSLRHAAASHALAQGVDLATISRRLGHASTATTARIYLSSNEERDVAAAKAMASLTRKKIVS